jgi:hypothetical protein
MHGAFATGVREAANVMAMLSQEAGQPVSERWAATGATLMWASIRDVSACRCHQCVCI